MAEFPESDFTVDIFGRKAVHTPNGTPTGWWWTWDPHSDRVAHMHRGDEAWFHHRDDLVRCAYRAFKKKERELHG